MKPLSSNSEIEKNKSLKQMQSGKASRLLRRAAVIGGGPSGIQAAGELMKQGFYVTLFERHNQLGGIWCYEKNNHLSKPSQIPGVKSFLPFEVSSVYKEMRINVPFQSMGIDGFQVPQPEKIRFIHRSGILDYLNEYVKHIEKEYSKMLDIRLNSNVISVEHDEVWLVTSQQMNDTAQEKYEVIVVATGAFHKPSGVNLHDPEFGGISFHSLYYDDPSILDSRTVLIIGGKNSARDVYWDAMNRAKHVVLASPSEKDRNNVAFPEGDYASLKEKSTYIGRVKRIFKDGTVLHTNWQGEDEVLDSIGIDMVIYCTGYVRTFPFLPEMLQPISIDFNGNEETNCFMFTAHKSHPSTLFFFHPSKARTPFNTMARETHAQARLIAALANREVFALEQLEELDETLQYWLDLVYTEWSKESLNSCPCAVQNPLFMNYVNAVVNHEETLASMENIGLGIMNYVREKMKEQEFRKQNTIWHAGMELRVRADAANWNLFRFLHGSLVAGPDVDGSKFYEVQWYFEDGRKHSTFHETEIKYEDVIMNG